MNGEIHILLHTIETVQSKSKCTQFSWEQVRKISYRVYCAPKKGRKKLCIMLEKSVCKYDTFPLF